MSERFERVRAAGGVASEGDADEDPLRTAVVHGRGAQSAGHRSARRDQRHVRGRSAMDRLTPLSRRLVGLSIPRTLRTLLTRCIIVIPFCVGLLISTALGPGAGPVNIWNFLCVAGILWQAIPGAINAARLAAEVLEYVTGVDLRSYRIPS